MSTSCQTFIASTQTTTDFVGCLALRYSIFALSSNEDVLCPDALRDRVKDAYGALGIEEEEPILKTELYVYSMPNGTFDISDAVSTEDLAAGPRGPGAPMLVDMRNGTDDSSPNGCCE